MSNRGGKGKIRGHRVKCGVKDRQERGLYAVRAACNEFFARRGMAFDMKGDFLFGSQDRDRRTKERNERRLDRIAEDLGQTEQI